MANLMDLFTDSMPSKDEVYAKMLRMRQQAIDAGQGVAQGAQDLSAAARPVLGQVGAAIAPGVQAAGEGLQSLKQKLMQLFMTSGQGQGPQAPAGY